MIEVRNFKCDSSTPSEDEIREGVQIANEAGCIVRLNWFFPYSGNYRLDIMPGNTFEDCVQQLPKCYPV